MKFRKLSKTDWKKLVLEKGDEELPKNFWDYARKNNALKHNNVVYDDMLYFKGDTIETATDWAFVTDDGGYYKVGAKWCFWHPYTGKWDGMEGIAMHCAWTFSHLKKNINSFLKDNVILRDPNYQT